VRFSEAIAANRLVPYEYDFIEIYLTPEEEEEFEILTKKMKSCLSWSNGVPSSTDASNHYARLRANIVKEAKNKDDKVINILKSVNKNDRWLVYCNSLSHMDNLRNKLADQKIESTVYHSQLSYDVKKATLNLFEREGGILLSIKCLDEGVDIPLLDHALIIASSGNPREYIQRRGRALRKAKGKYLAFLYDLVVLKHDGTPALIHEITRAQELASNSNNLMSQIKLRNFIEQWRKKNKIEEAEIEQVEEDEE
jgi:superfamily II DNA or RNA helicase